MSEIDTAKRVFDTEIKALQRVRESLDGTFDEIVQAMLACKGKVIVTGMGKSGHIGRKIAASLSSLGTSAFFLHPAEALHGDLGMLQREDVVIAISCSGESDEIVRLLPNIRMIGAMLIGLTCNPHSTLARASRILQVFPDFKEACCLGLAPTTSTTVSLVYGDALAVAASECRGFGRQDYGLFHPAGSLGKKLIYRVSDLMNATETTDVVYEDALLKDAMIAMSRVGCGLICVVDKARHLTGVLTDGVLTRALLNHADIYGDTVRAYMQPCPVYVGEEEMAIDALRIMLDKSVKSMPVLRNEFVVGVIRKQEITSIGIYV